MATFVLEGSVRTGIHEIDAAHQRLLDGLKAFVEAVRNDVAYKYVKEYLDLLEYLVVEHFRDEEAEMRRTGYPAMPAHVLQHESMTVTFKALQASYERRGCDREVITQLGNFMSDMVRNHVYRYDLHMALWFKEPEQNRQRPVA